MRNNDTILGSVVTFWTTPMEVWSKLDSTQPRDFGILLTADEITRWRDRTQVWYEDPAHDPRITPIHITHHEVVVFILQAAEEILATCNMWES